MKIRLFHHKGACSLAPLVALEATGLDYELSIIDLMKDRGELLQVNPDGKVPTLLVDDELLTENAAILYRIAGLAPGKHLFPTLLKEQSQVISLLTWFGTTMHILRRQIRMPVRFTDDPAAQQSLIVAGRPKMFDGFAEMERRLNGAEWFGRDTFNIADAYALVFYNWGLIDGFPMHDFHQLTSWKDRMLNRPAVRAALRHDVGPLSEAVSEGEV